jgi:hypothetical protein
MQAAPALPKKAEAERYSSSSIQEFSAAQFFLVNAAIILDLPAFVVHHR